MKIKLQFEQADFDSFATFEKSITNQIPYPVYTGTDNLIIFTPKISHFYEFPKVLAKMLRPFPEEQKYAFELNPDPKKSSTPPRA